MHYELLRRSFSSEHPLKHDYKILGFKDVEENGRIKKQSCVERVDTSNQLNSFKASDFKLDNILAVGAYDMLKPQVMKDTNPLSVICDFEGRIEQSLKGVEK